MNTTTPPVRRIAQLVVRVDGLNEISALFCVIKGLDRLADSFDAVLVIVYLL